MRQYDNLMLNEIIMENKHSNIKHRNNLHNDQAERYAENLKIYLEEHSILQRLYEKVIREKGSWHHKLLLRISIKYKIFKWLVIFIPIKKYYNPYLVLMKDKSGIEYKGIQYFWDYNNTVI